MEASIRREPPDFFYAARLGLFAPEATKMTRHDELQVTTSPPANCASRDFCASRSLQRKEMIPTFANNTVDLSTSYHS